MKVRALGVVLLWLAAVGCGNVAGQSVPPSTMQPQAPPEPIPTFASLLDLRARTIAEQQLAKYFDWDGPPIGPDEETVIIGEASAPPSANPFASRREPAYEERIREEFCRSDAMALGRVTGHRIFLNTSGSRIFTVYTFEVDRWIRPAGGPPSIHMGELGGRASVTGHFYGTRARPRLPFDEQIFVELRKVPSSSAFAVGGPRRFPSEGKISLAGRTFAVDDAATELIQLVATCPPQ